MMLYAISNSRNVARILSLGCLGSRAIYGEKYQEDGCELAGGRLVLFADPPDRTLLESVGRLDDLILVEVDLEIDVDSVTAIDGAVPSTNVRQLHFPSERSRDEFLSTPFDNVDPTAFASSVSSGMFEVEWPSETDELQPSLLGQDERQTSGAPHEIATESSTLSERVVTRLDRRLGALAEVLTPVRWNDTFLHAAQQMLREAVTVSDSIEFISHLDLNVRAMGLVEDALVEHPPVERPTRALVEHVQESAPSDWEHELGRVARVLRNREAFGDVGDWSDPLSAAFCLSLLRSSPATVRRELEVATEDAVGVLRLALWLSGLLRGLARRPTEERHPRLEPLLHRCLAAQLNHETGTTLTLALPVVTTDVQHEAHGRVYSLRADEEVLLSDREQLPLREKLIARVPIPALADGLGLNFPTVIRAASVTSIRAVEGDIEIIVDGDVDVEKNVDLELVRDALERCDEDQVRQLAELFGDVMGDE